jgi:Cdc6-like AAA superfamily ATPase
MTQQIDKPEAAQQLPDYTKMSFAERMRRARSIYVRYPRANSVYKAIKEIHEYSVTDPEAEPRGLVLKGPAGVGKSRIGNRYVSEFPPTEEEERRVVPVLRVAIPESATVKGFAGKMLKALGDPDADKGSRNSVTSRLETYIKECGVQLIIADEFQHCIHKENMKVMYEAVEWFKLLMDESRTPVVLIGTPACEQVLRADPQIWSRFRRRKQLSPFQWKTDKQKESFGLFLKELDERLPFNERSNLGDPDSAYRFYYASDGVIRLIVELVRTACELALKRKMEWLDLDVLAKAYDKELRQIFPRKENPFRAPNPRELKIERPKAKKAERNVTGGTNRRVRARKPKNPSASEVLRRRG